MKWTQVWLSFTLGLFLQLAPIAGWGAQVEEWRPTEASFNAEARGADCGVYRRLADRSQSELVESKKRLESLEGFMKTRWNELLACAASRGFSKAKITSYSILAEICPDAYHDWVAPGYRARIYQQDVKDSSSTVERLSGLIESHCHPLPPPEGVRPVSGRIF